MAECNHQNIVILAQAEVNAELHSDGRIEVDEAAGTLTVKWLFCTGCHTMIPPTNEQVAEILKALSFGDNGYVL